MDIGIKVFVIILDTYIAGRTERISPEAPIQVLDVGEESRKLGGAANVAANLKAMGAEVTAVDSRIKENMLRRIGADHVIDYARDDFTKLDQKYDVIFDMVAGSSYSGCIKTLKPDGRYLKGNPRLSDMLRAFLTTKFTGRTATCTFAGETEEELLTLKQMIEDDRIKPVIDRIYPPGQASEAHHRVETEQRVGIAVISMQEWINRGQGPENSQSQEVLE